MHFKIYRATASNAMQGIARRKPSVHLSVKRVDCDKTKGSSADIHIPHKRSFIQVFWQEEWLVGGNPYYLKF